FAHPPAATRPGSHGPRQTGADNEPPDGRPQSRRHDHLAASSSGRDCKMPKRSPAAVPWLSESTRRRPDGLAVETGPLPTGIAPRPMQAPLEPPFGMLAPRPLDPLAARALGRGPAKRPPTEDTSQPFLEAVRRPPTLVLGVTADPP